MTILFDARFKASMRGGDRCRYEVARCLKERRADRYAFLGYKFARDVLDVRAEAFIECPYLPHQHPQADLFEHIALPRFAARNSFALYHGTFQVLPLKKLALPAVVTIHDMAPFDCPEAYSQKFGYYMRFLMRRGIANADRIIAVSDATKTALIKYIPEAEPKVRTVLNGVGQEFRAVASHDPASARAKVNSLVGNTPYVLFVGNLEPKKNLRRLIAAFSEARRTAAFPHRLLIAGGALAKGPGVDTEEVDAVHFLGEVSDEALPLLYRGADLIAYPSIYEGFGMPVLEGLAAGVPVLTSAASSLPEVAGGAAMLVDPFDIKAIAAGLTRAMTDREWRQGASRAGLARASTLTWEACAAGHEAVYAELLDGVAKGTRDRH